jgi:hypothetical protein
MSQFLKENIVTKELAKGSIKIAEATKILSEATDFKFSGGEAVYVAHGVHAGTPGKFIKEANGGYAEVDLGTAGKTTIVPLIFLTKNQNK